MGFTKCMVDIEDLREEIQGLKNRISEIEEGNSILIQALIKVGFSLEEWLK